MFEMDIEQFMFAALNGDATLQSLWGTPAENPYLVMAPPNKTMPYTTYRLIANMDEPTLDDATGPTNNTLYSFTTWATSNGVTDGGTLAKKITDRIRDVLIGAVQPGGVQLVYQVRRMHLSDDSEQATGIVMDLSISDVLCPS